MPEHVSGSMRLRVFGNRFDNTHLPPTNLSTRLALPDAEKIPPRQHCSLHWLASSIYLFSFLSAGGSAAMLRHFMRHYLDGLGVKAAQASFVLLQSSSAYPGAPPPFPPPPSSPSLAGVAMGYSRSAATLGLTPGAAELLGILIDEAKVPSTNIRLVAGVTYSDALKIAYVNAHIRTLPSDAWFILADSDELFAYPCNLPSLVRAHGEITFAGSMTDRLALDGTIAPVRATPTLGEQYPLECRLRQVLSTSKQGSFNTVKVLLHRVYGHLVTDANGNGTSWNSSSSLGSSSLAGNSSSSSSPPEARLFRTPHALHGVHWTHERDLGMYAHYTLTEEAMNATVRKVHAHEHEAHARNGTAIDRKNGTTAIVCSLGFEPPNHPLTPGVCRDYTMLLSFMRAQQRNPMRMLTPFCYFAPEAPWPRRCEALLRGRRGEWSC